MPITDMSSTREWQTEVDRMLIKKLNVVKILTLFCNFGRQSSMWYIGNKTVLEQPANYELPNTGLITKVTVTKWRFFSRFKIENLASVFPY